MQSSDAKLGASNVTREMRLLVPMHPVSSILRRAIRANVVSFPSQIPVLLKHPPPAMQWRTVLLYYVCGWNSGDIAVRFNVPTHRIWQILNQWAVRAFALGYVQIINAEGFAACCHADSEASVNLEHAGQIQAVRQVDSGHPPLLAAASAGVVDTAKRTQLADSLNRKVALLAALDSAIEHCEDSHDDFWSGAADVLQNLRTVALSSLERPATSDGEVQPAASLQTVVNELEPGWNTSSEERRAHAAAS